MENLQPTSTRGRSARGVLPASGGIAKALSELDAVRETRKRKRGALQDISNNANKKAPTLTGKSGVAAVKKPVISSSTSSISVVTSTNRLRSVTAAPSMSSKITVRGAGFKSSTSSSINPTAGKRQSSLVPKKSDAITKRRKPEAEGNHHHASHKVQMSMLSFQTSAASTVSIRSSQNSTTGDDATFNISQKSNTSTSALMKKASAGTTEDDAILIECNEDMDSDGMNVDEPVVRKPVALPSLTSYTPRPYVFKYDHNVRDIDSPTPCAKLARELDIYYRKHEVKYLPEASYIGTYQTDINEKMRTILVDWLVEVGEEYDLDSQTFHKTINRKQFQLLGCACMMIAAKFEEVYGPNVEEFVYISDQTYTAEEMLDMEGKILQALEYRIASTTCYGFITRYMNAGCNTDKQRSLVMYRPSEIVASAVYLARFMSKEKHPWTPTLHHYSKYNPWDLKNCILDLCRLHKVENEAVGTQRDKAKAVSEKFLADKFHGASAIPSPDEVELDKSFFLSTSLPRTVEAKQHGKQHADQNPTISRTAAYTTAASLRGKYANMQLADQDPAILAAWTRNANAPVASGQQRNL
ncbi:Cyclin-like protein, partial [Globisporangium splendens]